MDEVKETDTIKELYIKIAIMKSEIKRANRLIQDKERKALREQSKVLMNLKQSFNEQQ